MGGTVEGAGVQLAYEERGAPGGAPVLLVHGLAATRITMRPLTAALGHDVRAVAYDRRGYGRSGAPEPYTGTTAEEQGEDAAALVRALGLDPCVVVGDGFGGLVALDLAHRHRALVQALVLVEPPVFALVPEATEVLAEAHGRLAEAVRAHGAAAGVAAWIGSDPSPDAVRGFYADVSGLASLALGRRELRGLTVPVALVTTATTPRHVRAATDALAALLPDARRAGDAAAAVRGLLGLPS